MSSVLDLHNRRLYFVAVAASICNAVSSCRSRSTMNTLAKLLDRNSPIQGLDPMPEVAESQLQQEKVLLEQIKTLFQSMGSLLAINVSGSKLRKLVLMVVGPMYP